MKNNVLKYLIRCNTFDICNVRSRRRCSCCSTRRWPSVGTTPRLRWSSTMFSRPSSVSKRSLNGSTRTPTRSAHQVYEHTSHVDYRYTRGRLIHKHVTDFIRSHIAGWNWLSHTLRRRRSDRIAEQTLEWTSQDHRGKRRPRSTWKRDLKKEIWTAGSMCQTAGKDVGGS